VRLTDISVPLSSFLPEDVSSDIPLDELMAIGAGLSASAAVMWVMSHPEAPIIDASIERRRKVSDMAMDIMERMSDNISDMTSDQIQAGAEVLKVLAPLGLLTP
jgi:hypothetical protein